MDVLLHLPLVHLQHVGVHLGRGEVRDALHRLPPLSPLSLRDVLSLLHGGDGVDEHVQLVAVDTLHGESAAAVGAGGARDLLGAFEAKSPPPFLGLMTRSAGDVDLSDG
eukprot:759190-Hanusia_phi.AAC.6